MDELDGLNGWMDQESLGIVCIKSFVNKWLPELPAVLAYHTAQRHHGGSGATYVLLKKSADKKHENREMSSFSKTKI